VVTKFGLGQSAEGKLKTQWQKTGHGNQMKLQRMSVPKDANPEYDAVGAAPQQPNAQRLRRSEMRMQGEKH